MSHLGKSCYDADSDSVGLGWELRFLPFSQVMLIKLVQEPHFEWQDSDNIMALSSMHSSPFIIMCLVTAFPSLESMSQRTLSDVSVSLLKLRAPIKMKLVLTTVSLGRT